MTPDAERDARRRVLWERGELSWKLRPHQRELYGIARSVKTRLYYVEIARRFGKSFTLCLVAVEEALRHSKRLIRFVAPYMKDLEEIYQPIMEEILEDCPEEMRPVWKAQKYHWYFPSTGSRLYMVGTDNKHYKKLRGKATHLGVIDEAGSCEMLGHIVDSILMPQTMGVGGRIFLATTPAETPGHDSEEIAVRCEERGDYIRRTIDDNTYITPEEKADLIERAGGINSSAAQREYYCKRIVETSRAVVPEFTLEKQRNIVIETKRPDYFTPWVAMDVGHEDFTVAVFCYYDFLNARMVVEDEIALRGATTDKIADAIKAKEKELWGDRKVYCRVSDTDLRLIEDLSALHDLSFEPTEKDHKEAQINKLRIWVKDERIIFDPRVKVTIRHLYRGVWRPTTASTERRTYERTKSDGHFDAIDAVVYALRNCPENVNPYPALAEGIRPATHFIPSALAQKQRSQTEAAVLAIVRGGRR